MNTQRLVLFRFCFAGLMLMSFFSLNSCKRSGIKIQTGKSEIKTLFARVTESGTIQPTIDVPISPDVPGEVVNISVREGMEVKKGELLITIQPDDYRAQLEQADAALSRSRAAYLQAKANEQQSKATLLQDSIALERTKKLYQDKVVSQVDLENAELRFNVSKSQFDASRYNVQSSYYQVKSSEASKKQARQNLDRTNIYASMDGTVTQLNVELGQRVVGTSMMSGTEILKIADLSNMEVIVEINENDIVNVSLGDSAKIEVDAFPDQSFYGKVSEIAYSATVTGMASSDQVTNFEVKVQISPESYRELQTKNKVTSPFRPGMTALVEIYTRSVKDVVTVPIQAVTLRKQKGEEGKSEEPQEVVFLYESDGTVAQVPVETGISDDTHIQIDSGLEAEQDVITGPYTTLSKILRDGMKVEVSAEKKWSAK